MFAHDTALSDNFPALLHAAHIYFLHVIAAVSLSPRTVSIVIRLSLALPIEHSSTLDPRLLRCVLAFCDTLPTISYLFTVRTQRAAT